MKLKLTKSLIVLLLVSASSLVLAASLAELAPVKEMEGTIQSVDFGANTMIFEGVRFDVLPDAEVEIRGSYGAFTMLQAGMKAAVTYRVVSESERHAIRVVQLPDNYRLEGA
ncbi:MAG: hypothetical protein EP301_10960 [Gammaproteobacteria bacterium]|jgi:hypothetical protein|nr:MAG: hypothetical protein EP301_10960 [Gammaproteobacteria bacterium]